MDFSHAIDEFLKRKHRDLAITKGASSKTTEESYRYRLEALCRFLIARYLMIEPQSPEEFEKALKHLQVTQITTDDLEDYRYEHLLIDGQDPQPGQVTANTINSRLYTYKSFWKEMNKIDSSIENITTDMERSRHKYERKPSVTKAHLTMIMDEFRRLHAEAKTPSKKINTFRDYILFSTVRFFGFRISSTLNLNNKSIFFPPDQIRINYVGKGNKHEFKKLPLFYEDGETPIEACMQFHEELRYYLDEVRPQVKADKKLIEDGPLFFSQKGCRLDYEPARRLFKKALTKLDLLGFEYTPHSLRHAFASHKLADGVPLQTVSRLLDHADVSVTSKIYAHSEEKDLVSGMGKGHEDDN